MKIFRRVLLSFILVFAVLFGAFSLYFNLCCEKVIISGSSMQNTLQNGQLGVYVHRDRLFKAIGRNDIVVFSHSGVDGNEARLVKRVIGLPHETVRILFDGTILIDGEEIAQNYLDEAQRASTYQLKNIDRMEVSLNENQYFVLGDNRSVSYDSRYFGAIESETILGKMILTYGKENEEGEKSYFPLKFLSEVAVWIS